MGNRDINKVYRFCRLLHIDSIRNEIEEKIKGYNLDDIKLEQGKFVCTFHKNELSSVILTASLGSIILTKYEGSNVERITVDENLIMINTSVEKRESGIIYFILQKLFASSERFKNEVLLVDLEEQRFVFTKDTLKYLFDGLDFDTCNLANFFLKFRMLERKVNITEQCDYFTKFSTHMSYYYSTLDDARKFKDTIYSTKTFLNGQDISRIYDTVDGKDKLYRIYDLYKWIINSRNENDINAINLGLLNSDAYDLMSLKEITEKEDLLVGESSQKYSEEYIDYIKEMLNDKFGYTGNIDLSRETIVTGIVYQMSGPERAKREIERKLGISYDEFEQLDLDEQHKLIEQKTGEKIKPDFRLNIDEIPMDNNHIIKNEQANLDIEMITASTPKRILKKIFKPLNRKR